MNRVSLQALPIDVLVRNFRYGFRALRKNPAFVVTAIATLVLCIGANTAIGWAASPYCSTARSETTTIHLLTGPNGSIYGTMFVLWTWRCMLYPRE
jgi:hypothetical protein